jgi:hypothetical protein
MYQELAGLNFGFMGLTPHPTEEGKIILLGGLSSDYKSKSSSVIEMTDFEMK